MRVPHFHTWPPSLADCCQHTCRSTVRELDIADAVILFIGRSMSMYASIYVYVWIYASMYLCICLSLYLFYLSICLSVCLSISHSFALNIDRPTRPFVPPEYSQLALTNDILGMFVGHSHNHQNPKYSYSKYCMKASTTR